MNSEDWPDGWIPAESQEPTTPGKYRARWREKWSETLEGEGFAWWQVHEGLRGRWVDENEVPEDEDRYVVAWKPLSDRREAKD